MTNLKNRKVMVRKSKYEKLTLKPFKEYHLLIKINNFFFVFVLLPIVR